MKTASEVPEKVPSVKATGEVRVDTLQLPHIRISSGTDGE